jgi:thiol-disulfide isomerase/thioredoxin
MRRLMLLGGLLLSLPSCGGGGSSSAISSQSAPVQGADTAAAGMAAAKGAESPQAPARSSGRLELRPATVGEILGAVRGAGSKAVLVNVWASWCAPCRQEFPDLVRLYRDYRGRGLELVLVSTDFEDQLADAKAFLTKNGVDFPTYFKVGDDMEFINTLSPKWTGALPATFIYDGEGRLRYFQEGMGTYEEFEKRVLDVLSSKAG